MKRIPVVFGRLIAAVVIVACLAGCELRGAVLDGFYLAVSETVAAAITGSLAAP